MHLQPNLHIHNIKFKSTFNEAFAALVNWEIAVFLRHFHSYRFYITTIKLDWRDVKKDYQ